MSEYLIQGETLTNIANAIREKKGTSDVILVSAFAEEISTIETGGGMLTASTEEEMLALITTENEGKIVLYSGETGEYVSGEYYKITSSGDDTQYYELDELTNPASAEDIASGKEAYGADGAVITGTMESVQNKLPLLVGTQSADNPYEITATDLEGVTELGDYAFYYRTGLRSISSNQITAIGQNAFSKCGALTSVDMPKLTSIGTGAFVGCNVQTLSFPEVTEVGDTAFQEAYSLSTISLPKVTSIGASAFRYCTRLETVSLPSLTSMGSQCFMRAEKLETISLPSLTNMGSYAFQNSGLKSADIPLLTSIPSNAFLASTSLTSVNMPSATSIGTSAFQSTLLASVDLSNVTTIGQKAFYECPLTSLDMPSTTSIGNYAFHRCFSLTTVTMQKVASIGTYAFQYCSALTSLTIPSTCTSISNYALQCGSTSNLCTFTFEGTTPPSIQSNTFNASYINKIIVPIGCGDTYKTATNWSSLASYIEEATE